MDPDPTPVELDQARLDLLEKLEDLHRRGWDLFRAACERGDAPEARRARAILREIEGAQEALRRALFGADLGDLLFP
jgi:hypothetical protein